MELFFQKRFVYQQQPPQPNPEVQSQPPVEAGKEAPKPMIEAGKEALPASPADLANQFKTRGKEKIDSENAKLSIFANLQPGVDKPVQPS